MKLRLPLKLTTLATATLASILIGNPVIAVQYGEKEIDQQQVIAVAVPIGTGYNLLIIEQIPGKKQCWRELDSQPPVRIDPLLLNFDFTGNCRRATDSNGYSLRLDGRDYGLDYLLAIVKKEGELRLVARPRSPRYKKSIVIGRTYGIKDGLLKIFLDPGWKFTKRTYEDKTLGHFYFSGDTSQIGTVPITPPPISQQPAKFRDIENDIYKEEIEQAVALGFISGFKEDNTFRPLNPLTREQLVSMVIGALGTIPELNINVPNQTALNPYPDVDNSRWSAAKIAWAKENNLVTGYPDGTFRPTRPVTRAELIAVLQKATQYARTKLGQTGEITSPPDGVVFTDITGHWAENIIVSMSSYCRVASPYNETGNNFLPNEPSQRNYAAAATLRMRNCLQKSEAN
ncbi:MAG: DUF3747 domain-containing protein [Cyanobacteria bacterium J083]|nr:MAG: DUF3747 domain-containing protein [Cyanobacteria bacterium J083]